MTDISEPDIRQATVADAPAIARFHVAVWRETYQNIAPSYAVAALDEPRRLLSWVSLLQATDTQQQTLLCFDKSEIIGLVSFGPPTDRIFAGRGEIRHLYIASSQRGRGLGRKLMSIAYGELQRAGFDGVGLSVVRENTSARQFYRALGGQEITSFTDKGPLWKSDNILVVWPALAGTSFSPV